MHFKSSTALATILAAVILTGQTGQAKDAPKLPLEGHTEKLEMTLSEGTWMSLDVQADGQSLVFELLGDFYQLPITGGTATPITHGIAFDSQPVLSLDGSKVAFVSDRDGSINLWMMNADGSDARQLSKGKSGRYISPTWTPDGQSIVVTQIGTESSFHLYHVDGKGSVELTDQDGKGFAGLGARFSPDGRYMYYGVIDRRSRNQMPTTQIHRFDMQTGDLEQITQGHGGGARPEISPDGRYMTYIARRENESQMRLRDLTTGADRVLVSAVTHDVQEIGRSPSRDIFPGYSFTPDSQAVIYTFGGQIKKVSLADGSISDIPFEAKASLDIGPDLTAPYKLDRGPVAATIAHNPSRSPDGKQLVTSMMSHLYVAGADGSNLKRLTKSDAWEFQPKYSPDGRWIAYVTWSMDQGGAIWKVRSNGRGRPEKLSNVPAYYTELAWSPDGKRIVAMRGNEWQRHQTYSEFGGLDIPTEMVWLPASGGDLVVIKPSNGARYPHFGPEADRIYSYSGEALISHRFDGSDVKEHLKVNGPQGQRQSKKPTPAEMVKISPNGKHVLIMMRGQVWVMPLQTYGGKVPTVSIRSSSIPAVRLTDIGADFMDWSTDGSAITWAIGSTYYERPFNSISFADEEEEDEKADKGVEKGDEASEDSGAEKAATDAATFELKEPALDLDENVLATKLTLKLNRHRPKGSILLSGGNVLQMAGDSNDSYSKVLIDADILVTNDRIVAVGPKGSLEVPKGTTVVDVAGKYIMPGMIDTHAHWEFRTTDVLEPQAWTLLAPLAYGVTTGLDVQTNHKDYFTYRDMVETGQTLGQRALMVGPGIFSPNDFQSYDSAYYFLKRYSQHYKTHNIKSYVAGNRQQRQWIVEASKAQGLLPTTEGGLDLRMDMTHAMDGMHGNEHNLPVFPLHDDVVNLFAKTRTAYTATLLVQYNGIGITNYFFTRENVHDDKKMQFFYPHNRLDELTRRKSGWAMDEEFTFKHVANDVANIQRAGGLVGMGGHGELQGLGYHWELWAHNMGGMKPVEVLRAATIDGAKIIGVEQDLGSIEPGKVADMVILDKNPLENIRNTTAIYRVMKDGFLFDDDNLTQVWPAEKPLAGYWWWHDQPK